MDYMNHKCIECKNKFYCYDKDIGWICFKQMMIFKTDIFSDSKHCEFVYCCSEQCHTICVKENKKNINKYYINRIKDNYENFFKTSIEFLKFICVMIYLYVILYFLIK